MLNRDDQGSLIGEPIDTAGVKPKAYRTERRQFAEAILSKAVLVVEGTPRPRSSQLHPQFWKA